MSLINQVLLDLDRRHAQQENVPLSARSVAQAPRKNRLALRIVAAFVAVGAGAGAAVVASTALPGSAVRTAISKGVVIPQSVASTTAPVTARDTGNTVANRTTDPSAADDSHSIGGNPLDGSGVRVASNSNDDVQLLAMSPAMPANISTSERAAVQTAGDDDANAPPVAGMPRLWDASPAAPKVTRSKAAVPPAATSWSDETNVAAPDAHVASLSPDVRRGAASTARSVIDAQDPDATIRKARSMIKPSVVRTEVKTGEANDAADLGLSLPAKVALAPAVIPATSRRAGSRIPIPILAPAEASVEKRAAPLSAADRADAEYQKALVLHLQGQVVDARVLFANALREDRRHAGARQALAVSLVGDGKLEEAQVLLAEGLELNPRELQLSTTLARIQAQRQDLAGAITTLKAALAVGPGSAQKSEVADARALLATLQQRSGAHVDAIENYSQALRQVPGNGTWWIGLGISLAATGRAETARDAFQRARATDSLSPDLDRYVEQRLLATAAH